MTMVLSSVVVLQQSSDDRFDGTMLRCPNEYRIVMISLYLVAVSHDRAR
jgi:hypothetical protein